MKFNITFKNQLRVLELLIITILGVFVFILYEINQNNFDEPLKDAIQILLLFNILPVLFLHLEYYFYNKHTQLEIDSFEKIIIYTDKSGRVKSYSFNDLSKIIIYMPPHFHSNKMYFRIPFDAYHYAKIFAKNGDEIIISCLMVSKVMDLVESIKGIPIEKKKRLFASILIG